MTKEEKAKKNKKALVQTVQITPKQEAFCILVAAGTSAKEAYREAYSCGDRDDQALREAASRLRRRQPTKSRILEIIMDRYVGIMMTQEQRIIALNDIVISGKTADAIKAIDMLNKMDGSYTEKLEVTQKAQITVYLPEKRTPLVVQS